jgi:hypothetical protein
VQGTVSWPGRDDVVDGVNLSQPARTLIAPVRQITDRGGKAGRSYTSLAYCDLVLGDSRPSRRSQKGPSNVQDVIERIDACGALDDYAREAKTLVDEAWKALDPLSEASMSKTVLRVFGRYVLEPHYGSRARATGGVHTSRLLGRHRFLSPTMNQRFAA